jgi:hypothetical protein
MNKKYTIVNATLNDGDFCIDYFFYIVIFILAIYLVIQFMSTNYKDNFSNYKEDFENQEQINSTTTSSQVATSCKGWSCNIDGEYCPQGVPGAANNSYVCKNGTWTSTADLGNNKENFVSDINSTNSRETFVSAVDSTAQSKPVTNQNTSTKSGATVSNTSGSQAQTLTLAQELLQAKAQNKACSNSRKTLEESMKKQARALFLSNNYFRIDDSSFNNEISFVNNDFVDIRLPESDFNGKRLIKTQQEWDNLLATVAQYQNLYKPGEIVLKTSDPGITKETICYRTWESTMANDPKYKEKYPECMVCSINPETDYKNTKSWKNSKTNIESVCLFNSDPTLKNGVTLNYDQCSKFCKISQ